jgi:hypothetical protein
MLGMAHERYTHIHIGEEELTVQHHGTDAVAEGVTCDVYSLPTDPTRDVGIITVEPGSRTPLQRVLGGERTIEGHLGGTGTLHLIRADGTEQVHHVDDEIHEPFSTEVHVGDRMQWIATGDAALRLYEVCYPPYEPGRFEDI